MRRSLSAVLIFTAVVSQTPSLHAQDSAPRPGRIAGKVLNAVTGDVVPSAQVTVEGTPIAAITNWAGEYALADVSAGLHTVSVRAIGYSSKFVAAVSVQAGATTLLNVTLGTAAVELEGITVTAEQERGSVSYALNQQRTANQIINTVTSEQIQKSPDSDAGQAIQRVSGVNVQDGKYVFVRGLGERYTTTALNGTRLPSAEPERKVVPLDLFPSGLLEGITTYKTFTPDQPGDFSGAQVNLKTRDFLLGPLLKLSASSGLNDAVTARRGLRAPTVGPEWLGFAGGARDLPPAARDAGTLQGLSQVQLNDIIASFRNAWSARDGRRGANTSFSLSAGGQPRLANRPFEVLGSLTYSYALEGRLDERRAVLGPRQATGSFDVENIYRGATGRTSVLWGGLLNVSARLGATGRVALNNTLTHSGDNEATRLAGFNNAFSETLEFTRLSFIERGVRSHQLTGQHLLAERHTFDWSATWSHVSRREPDRSDLVYQTTIDPTTGESQPYAWYGAPRSATKTFSNIQEDGYEGGINYRHVLGSPARPAALKVGAYAKLTDRDADTRAYDVMNVGGLSDVERAQPAEVIFDGRYAQQGRLFLAASAALGRYSAADRIAAGYAQAELTLSDRWRLIGGARVERARLEVRSKTIELGDTTTILLNTDVLPSLALTWRPWAAHNLRLSVSQTVARPEYRELSPTNYVDIGGQIVFGNLDLRRSLVRNFDLRWEWYPSPGQVVSAAAFAKQFERPIERVLRQTSGESQQSVTFVNARSAENYGVELELRHHLGVLATALTPITLFANTTLMKSDVRVGDGLSSLTNDRRAMVGQAGYVVNAGVTYTSPAGRANATVLYNVVGRRIYEAGIVPYPDSYEEARHLLDASVQLPLTASTAVKLDAKNLLDSAYRLTQASIDRLRYRVGRVFSIGMTWEP
ncbi:MAG TPA: TonB-dependent receptor [Gemmatimonadales bacterium]|nr:TonB-dependent receptor [Gemmatimonadales bacterium]